MTLWQTDRFESFFAVGWSCLKKYIWQCARVNLFHYLKITWEIPSPFRIRFAEFDRMNVYCIQAVLLINCSFE
jgi:hypothetical protein